MLKPATVVKCLSEQARGCVGRTSLFPLALLNGYFNLVEKVSVAMAELCLNNAATTLLSWLDKIADTDIVFTVYRTGIVIL